MNARRHGPSAQARRDALLQATVEIVAEQGMAAVTHRSVTERAGLPLATVSYFFSSIDDLPREALRTFMARERDAQTALADEVATGTMSADEMGRTLAAANRPRLPNWLAHVESLLHAARHPEFRDPVHDALESSWAVARAVVRAVGAPEAEAAAPALTALAHGLALDQLAVGTIDDKASYQAFRALILGYLLDNGQESLALSLAHAKRQEDD
ncbi:TetR/AcrR family transcriptional regulator [Nocardia sp. NPDC004068]|uniref:TetR/AcrR family transcriptional regulator n=1 Tax=Nocardia sp. NPDC004068 TaxID=3364303 RepID=UPI0036BC887A